MKTRNLSLGMIVMALIAGTFHAVIAQHSQERIIRRMPIEKDEPLAVTDIRVNERSVSFDEGFPADDDWMRTLVISVKSKSDRRILFADLELFFHRLVGSKDQLAMFDLLFYGNHALLTRPPTPQERLVGIAPGETVEIGFSVQKFSDLQGFLSSVGLPKSVEKVDLRFGSVIFEDDTMWRGGLFRRDPNNPGSWNNVEPSPESQRR